MAVETDRTALVIIDMQKDFVKAGHPMRVEGAFGSLARVVEALELFRELGWPVFHVVREYRADGSDVEITRFRRFVEQEKFAVPGTEGCEIVDELKPLPGEYRIVKNRFSAFMATELDFILRRLRIERIAVAGTQYPNCIRTTVFDGVSLGYEMTVLVDACSAATPEIARANILDIRNIGVECIPVAEFRERVRGLNAQAGRA